LRGLCRAIEPGVALGVLAEPGADLRHLRRLVRAVAGRRRVPIGTAAAATVYARDPALPARDRRGRPALLVPRGFRPERAMPLRALAARRGALGVPVRRSLLYWEGGNIVHDAARCLVGADTIAENRARLGLPHAETLAILRAELGRDVRVLGEPARARLDPDAERVVRSGQAAYHLDLDVALLGRVGPDGQLVALLADPALGLALLPRVLAHPRLLAAHFAPRRDARRLLAAAYRREAVRRMPSLRTYRRQLVALGYRVVGVPDLRTDTRTNLQGIANVNVTCCNVLPARRGRIPVVYYLPWGIPALDRAAVARYREAGVAPRAVSDDGELAHELMRLHAGLRCLTGLG